MKRQRSEKARGMTCQNLQWYRKSIRWLPETVLYR